MKANEHEDDYRGDSELLFPSKYIRGADLAGKDVTVTVKRIEKGAELVKAGGEIERKPVMHFAETEKMLVLNKTNMRTIAGLYGKPVADWLGKKIVLFPAPWRGDAVCVRVRDKKGGE